MVKNCLKSTYRKKANPYTFLEKVGNGHVYFLPVSIKKLKSESFTDRFS